MKVIDFCKQNKGNKKGIWLCPNICTNMSVTARPYEQGLEYDRIGSIPIELQNKEVVKGFVEDDILCVIWKNH